MAQEKIEVEETDNSISYDLDTGFETVGSSFSGFTIEKDTTAEAGGGENDEPIETKDNTEDKQEDKSEESPKPHKEKDDTPVSDSKNSPTADADANQREVAISYVKDLFDAGVLSSFDEDKFKKRFDEVGYDAIIEVQEEDIDRRVSNAVEEEVNELNAQYDKIYNSPAQKEFLNLIKNGVDFESAKKLFIEKKGYESISDRDLEDNESLCKELIIADSKAKGLSDRRIERLLAGLDEDTLIEEAKDAKTSLLEVSKEKEKQKLKDVEENEKQRREYEDQLNKSRLENMQKFSDYIAGVESVGELKVTNTDRKNIYQMLTRVVDYVENPQGQKVGVNTFQKERMKNAMAFDFLVAFYMNKGLFKFDDKGNPTPDLSFVEAKAKKAVSKNLSEMLEKTQKTIGGAATPEKGSGNLMDFLQKAKGKFDY